MNFIIAERDGLRMLIVEHDGYNEYRVLEIGRYRHSFSDRRPMLVELHGMKIRIVDKKEFLAILENYNATEMIKYIEETIPF